MSDKDLKLFLKENYNIDVKSMQKIKHGVINFNYIIKTSDTDYLFKIYRLRKPEQVIFELEIFEFLKSKDFPCPRVFRNTKGELYSLFDSAPCVLLNYIPGEMLQDVSPDILHKTGKQLAELHKYLKDYSQPVERELRDYKNIKDYVKNDSQKIIDYKFPDAKELIDYIDKELEKLDLPDNLPQGITHQDVKPENIIIDDSGNLSFIDFDYAYCGILLYDITTTVIWTCFKNEKLEKVFLDSFLKGYESARLLDQKENECFNDALKFRLLREAFIWPWLLLPYNIAKPKSDYFLRLYKNL